MNNAKLASWIFWGLSVTSVGLTYWHGLRLAVFFEEKNALLQRYRVVVPGTVDEYGLSHTRTLSVYDIYKEKRVSVVRYPPDTCHLRFSSRADYAYFTTLVRLAARREAYDVPVLLILCATWAWAIRWQRWMDNDSPSIATSVAVVLILYYIALVLFYPPALPTDNWMNSSLSLTRYPSTGNEIALEYSDAGQDWCRDIQLVYDTIGTDWRYDVYPTLLAVALVPYGIGAFIWVVGLGEFLIHGDHGQW